MRPLVRRSFAVLSSMLAAACSSAGTPSQSTGSDGGAGTAAIPDARSVDLQPEPVDPVDAQTAVPERSIETAGAAEAGATSRVADVSGWCLLKNVGVSGVCIDMSACASLGGHVSTPGLCPGPASVACCTEEPHVEDHAHPPAGWVGVPQAHVSAQMTAWALTIVASPATYPMGSKTTRMFGTRAVMARVEWHPPDLGHGVVHRGVTLYEPG